MYLFCLLTAFCESLERSGSDRNKELEEITVMKYYSANSNNNEFYYENLNEDQREQLKGNEYYNYKSSNLGDYADWLSKIPGNELITKLSIPGTHESSALYGYPFAQCQSLTLAEQLRAGVRYFDIRCRHINNIFAIHHGLVYQKINFGSGVRDVFIDFLNEHPNEFILMMVKPEYDETDCTRSFEETMQSYITGLEKYFYIDEFINSVEDIPTVDKLRGKIVLYRRFDSSIRPMGTKINFQDDAIFTDNSYPYAFRVQDCYKLTTIFERPKKWKNMQQLLNEARESTDLTKFFINYGSGSGALCYPENVAGYINPLIGQYLRDNAKTPVGVLMIDFIDSYFDNIISYIIQRNFDDNANIFK